MFVQLGLCRTCSKTRLLVFPQGGSCKMYYSCVHSHAVTCHYVVLPFFLFIESQTYSCCHFCPTFFCHVASCIFLFCFDTSFILCRSFYYTFILSFLSIYLRFLRALLILYHEPYYFSLFASTTYTIICYIATGNVPSHVKTSNLGFQPGPTQTRLYS